MSGDHAKKEMETGEKPTTSYGSTSSEESRTKRREKKKREELAVYSQEAVSVLIVA